jgi:hypothetical protein
MAVSSVIPRRHVESGADVQFAGVFRRAIAISSEASSRMSRALAGRSAPCSPANFGAIGLTVVRETSRERANSSQGS